MYVCHQQLALADELAVFLSFDGSYGDGTTAFHIESVGLTGIHLGMSAAVTHQCALTDLGVDAAWNQKGDIDVGIFQLQRLVKAEQGVFGGTISTAQWKSKQP